MFESLFFGKVKLKIEGFNTSVLVEKLYKSCKVISLYTVNDAVFLTTVGIHENRVRNLCESADCICETLERRGAIYTVSKYFRRYGVYLGLAAAAVIIVFLSNTVMKIEVLGTDNESLKSEIRAILAEQGLKPGAYIPSLNFLKLSNQLFNQSDSVAWASIGSSGSVVYVNITESTLKTNSENTRIPCNIVASRDAVIVDAEVMVGKLEVLLGDAVYKGQLLVSGIIDHQGVSTKYYHSYARIIGRFEEKIDFIQNYTEEELISGEVLYRKALGFFDFEMPIGGDVLKNGANYSIKDQKTSVKLFGFTTPFSVITYEYTERKEDIKNFSTEEAYAEVYRRLENYEKNFLSDKTVVDRKITEYSDDVCVSLHVEYVLEGDIGKTSEIYIK